MKKEDFMLKSTSNFEEFKEFVDNSIRGKSHVAFDVETNAQEPRSDKIEIIGFSMSAEFGKGIYVSKRSLETHMDLEDWNKCIDIFKELNESVTWIIHNVMYEYPVVLNDWGIRLKNFDDTLVKSRLHYGNSTSNTLKTISRKLIDSSLDWEVDVNTFIGAAEDFLKYLKGEDEKYLEKGNVEDEDRFVNYLSKNIYNVGDLINLRINSEKSPFTGLQSKIIDKFIICYSLMSKYYQESDLFDISKVFLEVFIDLVKQKYEIYSVLPYDLVPGRILTKYGAIDSVTTLICNRELDKLLTEDSKEFNVHLLSKGYRYVIRQVFAGIQMEMSGLNFDIERAINTKKMYNKMALDSLIKIVESPLIEDYLYETNKWLIADKFIEEDLYLLEDNPEIGKFSITKSGIKSEVSGLIRWKKIKESYIPESYYLKNKDWCISEIRNKVRSSKDYRDNKKFLNLNSTMSNWKDQLNRIFVTKNIKLAKILELLKLLTNSEGFDLSRYDNTVVGIILKEIIDSQRFKREMESHVLDNTELTEFCKSFKLKSLSIKDFENEHNYSSRDILYDKDLFEKFYEYIEVLNFELIGQGFDEIDKLVIQGAKLYYDSLAEVNVVEINMLNKLCGIDIDKPETFTENYKFLINFRTWKKCNKLITTYIEGNKVGLGNVWLVDKNDWMSGNPFVKRLKKAPQEMENIDTEKYRAVMQPYYAVASANTYRWRCLTGDTLIHIIDEGDVPIRDLVGRDSFKVYSFDLENSQIVEGTGHDAHISYYEAPVKMVIFKSGTSIRCTGNHPFLNSSGIYINAEDLSKGDKIMTMTEVIGDYKTEEIDTVIEAGVDKVYDISVDDYNNFAISLGNDKYVFVHNTGMHTIPQTSEIKSIYTSRFKGGCVFAPDFCLSGDTEILLADGTHPKIKDLVGKEVKVASYSEKTKEIVQGKAFNIRKVRDASDLVRIYFDNYESVLCTKGHKFYKYDIDKSTGEMVEAFKLKENDKIVSYKSKYISQDWSILEKFKAEVLPHSYDETIYNIFGFLPYEFSSRFFMRHMSYMKFITNLHELGYFSKSYADYLITSYVLYCKERLPYAKRLRLIYNKLKDVFGSVSYSDWDYKSKLLKERKLIRSVIPFSRVLELFKSSDNFENFCKYDKYHVNLLRVEKIEEVNDTIPVYCMTVENYHNFFLYSGVLSSNSQMEVRTLAGASNCEPMLEAFRNGADIHRRNAASMFQKPPEEVTDAERRYCLSGDTQIKLLDGTTRSIRDLSESDAKNFWVYSFDIKNNKMVPGKALYAKKTVSILEKYIITFDNGRSIECTGNHRFLTLDNKYIEAKDLELNSRIKPLYFDITKPKDYRIISKNMNKVNYLDKGYEIFIDSDGDWYPTHRRVTDIAYPGVSFKFMTRHHKNFNKLDNRPENLQLLPWKDHINLHNLLGTNNFRELNKELWDYSNPKYEKSREKHRIGHSKSMKDRFKNDPEFLRKAQESIKYARKIRWSRSEEHKKFSKYYSSHMKERWKIPEYVEYQKSQTRKLFLNTRLNKSLEICSKVINSGEELSENSYNKFRVSKSDKISTFTFSSLIEKLNFKLIIEYVNSGFRFPTNGLEVYKNHRVIDIKKVNLSIKEDMYDIEVEKYNNFLVQLDEHSGVFVHNSKMGCLVGDTLIKLANGTVKSIEELYKTKNRRYFSYSCDTSDKNKLQVGKIVDIQLTKYTKELVKVTLSNGYSITCTPDHKLLKKYNELDLSTIHYIEAKDSLGSELEVIYNRYDNSKVYPIEELYDNNSGKWIRGKKVSIDYTRSHTNMNTLYPSNYQGWIYSNSNPMDNNPYNVIRTSRRKFRNRYSISKERRKLINDINPDPSNKVIVTNVEFINLDKEVPVYDLSVEDYHNYSVYLGDNTSLVVHNTFHILYGGNPDSFADEFLNGDRALGHQIFEKFYSAFPQIKDWIEKKHEEGMKYHKVVTSTDLIIPLDENDLGSESKLKRASQNYPINL